MKIQKGITIVELLVTFGIIGLVSILIFSIYFSYFKVFTNQNNFIDITSQDNISLDEITTQTRQSQTVVTSCCTSPIENTSATELVLQLCPINSSGNPIYPCATNPDHIIYKISLDGKSIIKRVVPGSGSSRLTLNNHTVATLLSPSNGLQFNYFCQSGGPCDGTPSQAYQVKITVNTTSNTPGSRAQSFTLSGSALLRNK